ncbi:MULTISPECIES: sigma-54 interaction domain-containing protein [unclassified Sedimentibacter]|uniref:sigma-54 interaction domain-containing protein n=1 Tax=unclassified Sedimentibacter TaxID=2649220 RepID=UPI0027DF64B4|nr:sigma 54-interacting transcriptional regulator [Sedimentibacter sp. MB35-C1]WMJ77703.1 sigma 54-interacting transcriptional regulator [Sedimentibacter sp. MB35-C1]
MIAIVRKAAIITLSKNASLFYKSIFKKLFGNLISISCYSVLDGSVNKIDKADIFIVSTDAFDSINDCEKFIPQNVPKIELNVEFTIQNIDTLMKIPKGTCAYFVNLSEIMVRECIARLSQLGVNHINFIPCFPGSIPGKSCNLAITAGEGRYAPDEAENIIDLGDRIPDTNTIVETALRLKLDYLLEKEHFKEYFNSIATSNYNFNQIFGRSLNMESQFEILMEIIDAGIIGVNESGTVISYNSKAAEITGINQKQVINKSARSCLHFLPFAECKTTERKITNRLVKFKDVDINATIAPVIRGNKYIGAFATIQKFTEEEYKQHNFRMQLLSKGHTAKYTFNDITGESDSIKRACAIAKKMAKNNSAVLITGESGTGKELFAQAIHNESDRNNNPFIAINCAAMPDNLLESELFGYEEGAFTGARRGGKLGLFEFAHKGSIFLDEVEGMSPALQIKLLRVLQEREIMRVGGDRIISVDVRIIAASNETLEDLVADGIFRSDLYYRLNTLPIEIPPLRERGGDIMLLFENIKKELNGRFTLSAEVKNAFMAHDWKGNVRELHNYVEYLTYLDKPYISYEDLPKSFHKRITPLKSRGHDKDLDVSLLKKIAGNKLDDYTLVLGILYDGYKSKKSLGRLSIAEKAQNSGHYLTQQEVRSILYDLSNLGLVKISQGRGGSKINDKGIRAYNNL